MQGQRIEAKRRNRSQGGRGWIFGLLALLIGVGIGFGIGYYTIYVVNATPSQLGNGSKLTWIDMTADSYQVTENLQAAQRRLGLDRADSPFFETNELAALFDNRISRAENAGELGRAEWLRKLAGNLRITPASLAADGADAAGAEGSAGNGEEAEGMLGTALMACGGILAVLGVLAVIAVLWTRRRQNKSKTRPRATMGNTRNRATVAPSATGTSDSTKKPASSRSAAPPPPPPPPAPTKRVEPKVTKADNQTDQALKQLFDDPPAPAGEKTLEIDFSDSAPQPVRYSPPLDEFRTRYNHGDDGYDMSFSIETPNSEFLGECGVGISDTINKGTPQQATAFEVWLFDKDDIRTVTKVLLSEHAWNDETLRQHLAPKGELILVKENETVDLETKSLRVRARIREAEYGTQSSIGNGYFERLVIELTPQQKQ